ncbi:hypothetical protein [Methylomonas methanica]|uniref:Lipoprotein n=1 Tax=Methylomonas methanica TaxID=421 RepID=A0A177MQF4_METMH|nr:hypothetical protein [Methylomonas methanica]OAI07523.1 hypothetical protein A1332_08550 [Methylomonas methanica]
MKKMQAATFLLMSTLIIACDKKTEHNPPVKQSSAVPTLLKQTAIMAEGINFKTNQSVVIDALTGKEVKPCTKAPTPGKEGASKDTRQSNQKTGPITGDCQSQILSVDEAVLNAMKITGPVDGVILKNNKEVKAKFFVSVKAVFEGSYCNTYYVNGDQYEICYSQEEIDAAFQ